MSLREEGSEVEREREGTEGERGGREGSGLLSTDFIAMVIQPVSF